MAKFTAKQKQEAEALWLKLATGFIMCEEAITSIIENKAWLPLGYATFAEAWRDRMSEIRLAVELNGHVVFALFDDGLTDMEIATIVKGIGVQNAANLRSQKSSGVLAGQAIPTRGARPKKYPPSRDFALHLEFTPDEIAEWKAIALDNGFDLKQTAIGWIRGNMAALRASQSRRTA